MIAVPKVLHRGLCQIRKREPPGWARGAGLGVMVAAGMSPASEPHRDWRGRELAERLQITPRNLHTQLGEWAKLGFITRTGFAIYALNTPPSPESSTADPDP